MKSVALKIFAAAILIAAFVLSNSGDTVHSQSASLDIVGVGNSSGYINTVLKIPFEISYDGDVSTVSASAISSNINLVSNSSITVQGVGNNRAVYLTPTLDMVGSTDITLTITDNQGLTDSRVVTVTFNRSPHSLYGASIHAHALVDTNTPKVTLTWIKSGISEHSVYRRNKGENDWGSKLARLQNNETSFVDTNVRVGGSYEYKIESSGVAPNFSRHTSQINVGLDVPLVENRGRVLLLIDSTLEPNIRTDLGLFEKDLIADGWSISKELVSPTQTAIQIKDVIKRHANQVRSVFIIGKVAVPFSGYSTPDGHRDNEYGGNHAGSWVADSYYADIDGAWTDTTRSRDNWELPLRRLFNRNYYNDGRFDQSTMPSDAELEVGRVTLDRLPVLGPYNEVDLMKRYFKKDHDYRYNKLNLHEDRVAVLSRLNTQFGGPFSQAAINYSNYFGSANIEKVDWFTEDIPKGYVWGFADNTGHDYGIYNTVRSLDYSHKKMKVVHNQMFGSYFGDWYTGDNFLRTIVGSEGYALSAVYGQAPQPQYFHTALGETIGYGIKYTQNSEIIGTKFGFPNATWTSLLGDPTLRINPVDPVHNLYGEKIGNSIKINWDHSSEDVLGYQVWRSSSEKGNYGKISGPGLIESNTFTDDTPFGGTNYYMVKAIKLEFTGSGTYYNSSQGQYASVNNIADNVAPTVDFINPIHGQAVLGEIDVEVSAGDNNGVSKVELYVDDVFSGMTTLSPYTIKYDTSALSVDDHVFKVIAYDSHGNTSEKNISVDVVRSENQPPQVTIASLQTGDTVYGRVPVIVEAIDNDRLDRVEVYVNGIFDSSKRGDEDLIFPLELRDVTATPKTISVVAVDRSGNVGGHEVFITSDKTSFVPSALAASPAHQQLRPGEMLNLRLNWQGGPTQTAGNINVYLTQKFGEKQKFQDVHIAPIRPSYWSGNLSYDYHVSLPPDLLPGMYDVEVSLIDGSTGRVITLGNGNTSPTVATLEILGDEGGPSIEINVDNNELLAGKIPLQVSSTDDSLVKSNRIYVDNVLEKEQSFGGLPTVQGNTQHEIDFSSFPNGQLEIRIESEDMLGNVSVLRRSVVVDNPIIHQLSPVKAFVEEGSVLNFLIVVEGGSGFRKDESPEFNFISHQTGNPVLPIFVGFHYGLDTTAWTSGRKTIQVTGPGLLSVGSYDVLVRARGMNDIGFLPGPSVEYIAEYDAYKIGQIEAIASSGGVNPLRAISQNLTTASNVALDVDLLVTNPNSSNLTYSVVQQPRNGTLIGSSPNYLYRANHGFVGEETISFYATDGINTSGTAFIEIDVRDRIPNDEPSIGSITTSIEDVDPNRSGIQIVAGSTIEIQVDISDDGVDFEDIYAEWSYRIDSSGPYVSQGREFYSDPQFTHRTVFTFPESSAGSTYTWKASVSDDAHVVNKTIDIEIVDGLDSLSPLTGVNITSPADNSSIRGLEFLTATYEEDLVPERFEFFADGLKIHDGADQQFVWDSLAVSNGIHTLLVTMTTTGGQTYSDSISVNVVNNLPGLQVGDRVEVNTPNSVLNVRNAAFRGTVVGTQLHGSRGTIVAGPESGAGPYVWWEIDYDSGVDGWGAESFLLEYIDPNSPPIFTSTPPLEATSGDEYLYRVSISDDKPGASLSINNKPAWLTFSLSDDGLLSGTPTNDVKGFNNVEIVATDSDGEIAIQSFQINVREVQLVPNTPTNLTIERFSQDQIQISWLDNSSDETQFQIERATSDDFVPIASVVSNVTTFTDSDIVPGNTYFYRITAVNVHGNSEYSNVNFAKIDSLAPASQVPETPVTLAEELFDTDEGAVTQERNQEEIKLLERALITLNYLDDSYISNGQFNQTLEDALRTFQRNSDLPETGRLDSGTRLFFNVVSNNQTIQTDIENTNLRTIDEVGTTVPGRYSYNFTVNLRVGDRNEDVRELQKFLNASGYTVSSAGAGSPGNETNFFGNKTKAALIKFQNDYAAEILHPVGLSRGTGVFGPSTRRFINGNPVDNPNPPVIQSVEVTELFTRNLKVGSRHEDVRRLQIFLNQNGFTVSASGAGSPGQETAYFGNRTKQAVIRFQDTFRSQILTPVGLSNGTGFFGASTRSYVNTLID